MTIYTKILTEDEVASAVVVKLGQDRTLRRSEYLDGLEKVWKFASPINIRYPRIVVQVIPISVSPHDTFSVFQVDIDLRIETISGSKLPDAQRFSRIQQRINDIIVGNGTIEYPDCRFSDVIYVGSGGIVESEVQREEFQLSTRYYVYGAKTS